MLQNKKYLKILLIFLFIPSGSLSQEIPTSVISISNPDIRVLSSKDFTWSPRAIYVYDDKRFGDFPLRETFEEDIKEVLTKNGFKYVDSVDQSGLIVGYVLALESSLSDMDINNLYGMNPGFIPDKADTDKYEKGTIIIDIIESRTNRMIWRGALQGMANFEVSGEERKKRIKTVVNRLLSEFIKDYGNR